MIAPLTPVTVKPVETNQRLYALHRLCATGTATRVQLDELDAMARTFATEQDNEKGQDDGR